MRWEKHGLTWCIDSKLMNGVMFWTAIPLTECDTFVELRGYGTKIVFNFDWVT